MSTSTRACAASHHQIYPAYCNVASPTFNKWVKLTAADVHGLRREAAFEGQGIYFHLNHPIRYVYLVGVVVSIEWFTERWVLLTLDDGSGSAIEVKIERIVPPKPRSTPSSSATTNLDAPKEEGGNDSASDSDENPDAVSIEAATARLAAKQGSWSPVPLHPATHVPNVRVTPRCPDPYCNDHRHLELDDRPLAQGTILKAKGSLASFRGTMQIVLERASAVLDAEEEPRIWRDYASFVASTLCKPWILSAKQIQALEEQTRVAAVRAESERRAIEERRVARAEKLRVQREKIARHEDRAEARRQAEREALDGNPLDRPGWRPWNEVVAEKEAEQEEHRRREERKTRRREEDVRVEMLRRTIGLKVAGV